MDWMKRARAFLARRFAQRQYILVRKAPEAGSCGTACKRDFHERCVIIVLESPLPPLRADNENRPNTAEDRELLLNHTIELREKLAEKNAPRKMLRQLDEEIEMMSLFIAHRHY